MLIPLRKSPVEIELPEFGISAFSSRHAPNFSMPFSSSNYDKVCYIHQGSGQLEYSTGTVFALEEGSLFLVPSSVTHRFVDCPSSPLTLSVLCIGEVAFRTPQSVAVLWNEAKKSLPEASPGLVSFEKTRTEFQRLFSTLILEMGSELPHRDAAVYAHSVMLITSAVRSVCRASSSDHPKAPEALLASIATLDDRFTEDVNVGELAEAAGMSYRSYSEHFRKYTGMSVVQYVTHKRLEFAKRRMLETGDIMGSSLEAGFQDLSHFYRVFKRHTGETPQNFIDTQTK